MKRSRIAMGSAAVVATGVLAFAGGTAAPAPGETLEPSRTMSVRVGLAERRMYVTIDGVTRDTFRVTVGSERHPTPKGSFQIRSVIWNPSWVPPESVWAADMKPTPPGDPNNPMGRVKMYFKHPTYYVHGTNDDWTIGFGRSHGCVRMKNEDAIRLAQLVMEHGGEPRPPNWFRRIINSLRNTEEVHLSTPVPMEVVPGTPPTPLGEAR